jgi:hypothetical protein
MAVAEARLLQVQVAVDRQVLIHVMVLKMVVQEVMLAASGLRALVVEVVQQLILLIQMELV